MNRHGRLDHYFCDIIGVCVCVVVHASVHRNTVFVCISDDKINTVSISPSDAQASCESYFVFTHFFYFTHSLLCFLPFSLMKMGDYRNKFIFCAYHWAELISILIMFFSNASLYLSTIRQQQPQYWWLIEAMHMTGSYCSLGKPPLCSLR